MDSTMSDGALERDMSRAEGGFSLIEVMVAMCVLLVVAAGVLPMGIVASKAVENQGHLSARTTEYAQDKLEQLLALSFGDSTSDTRAFPATLAGGTGLAVGGSADPAAAVNLYVDYLQQNGTLIPGGVAGADWFFQRVWRVELMPGSTTLKRVTVTATVRVAAQGGVGVRPISTVTALKTSPF
jgi:prepilin-type N-terminal cleavage/methylation domain-containing protein